VARAESPRHRRPRLRHRTRRRGEASAAFRPPQARARSVVTVCLSAQPLADRSVQRLTSRCRWTAPAHGWAARPRSCPPSLSRAFCRALTFLSVSVASAGRRARQTCFGASGLRSQTLSVPGTGGARACRTRRGRRPADRVGTTCPHTPAQVAPLRWRSNGLVLAGLCAADRAAVEGFPWPRRPRGWTQLAGRSPGLRLAAAFFLLTRRSPREGSGCQGGDPAALGSAPRGP